MGTIRPAFSIEATSHCLDGRWPRWSWWIRGIYNSGRYGVVGTDETGRGLFLYSFRGDHSSERQALLAPDAFTMGDDLSRTQANAIITHTLLELGWGFIPSPPVSGQSHAKFVRS